MGLHPAMYCTPYLISSNVVFLTGTCFIVHIFLKDPVYAVEREIMVKPRKKADKKIMKFLFYYLQDLPVLPALP